MKAGGIGAGFWLALALVACNGAGDTDDGDDTGSDSGDTGSDSGDTGSDSSDTDDTANPSDTPEVALFPASPIPGRPVHCVVEADPTPPGGGALAYAYTWSIDGATIAATTASIDGEAVVAGKSVGCTATGTTGAWTSEPGTATGTAGPLCGAVDFTETTLEAYSFDAASLLGDRTYEMWLRFDDVQTWQSLLRKGNPVEWSLYVDAGEITFATDSWHIGGGDEPECFDLDVPAPSVGEWHHVALTWQSATSTATLWVDGQQAGQCGGMSTPSGTSGNLRVGAAYQPPMGFPGYWWGFLDGALDEVRVSSSVRYTSTFVPPAFFADDATAEAMWRFLDRAGGYDDLSGNGRNLLANELSEALVIDSTACDVLDFDPANNRPTTPVVAVRPAGGGKRSPTDDEQLSCAFDVPSRDPEADAITTAYRWFVDDVVVTGQTTANLPASATAVGDAIVCEVTVSDAGGAIPAVESAPRVLRDTCDAVWFDGYTTLWGPENAYEVAWGYHPFTTTGNALTLEAWVKPSTTSGEQAFIAQNAIPFHLGKPDYYLGYLGGKLVFDTFPHYPSPSTSTECWRIEVTPPSLHEWHHFAGVIARDQSGNGTKRLFVDGEEVGSCTFTGMSEFDAWAGSRLVLGGYYHGGYSDLVAGELVGAMSGARISDSARYTADFTPEGALAADDDTVSLWTFGEGPFQSTLVDSVGDNDVQLQQQGPWTPEDPWEQDCP